MGLAGGVTGQGGVGTQHALTRSEAAVLSTWQAVESRSGFC